MSETGLSGTGAGAAENLPQSRTAFFASLTLRVVALVAGPGALLLAPVPWQSVDLYAALGFACGVLTLTGVCLGVRGASGVILGLFVVVLISLMSAYPVIDVYVVATYQIHDRVTMWEGALVALSAWSAVGLIPDALIRRWRDTRAGA